MADSIREQILEAMVERFESLDASQPVDDPIEIAFTEVTRLPIAKLTPGRAACAGVYSPTQEQANTQNTILNAKAKVVIEFSLWKETGVNVATQLERYVTGLTRAIMSDPQWGGRAIDTVIESFDLNIDGQYDTQVDGALYCDVYFRHHVNDPRIGV